MKPGGAFGISFTGLASLSPWLAYSLVTDVNPWHLWTGGGRNWLRCLLTGTACCPKFAVREGPSQRLTIQALSSLLQCPLPSLPFLSQFILESAIWEREGKKEHDGVYFPFWTRSLPSGVHGLQYGLSFSHCRHLAAHHVWHTGPLSFRYYQTYSVSRITCMAQGRVAALF